MAARSRSPRGATILQVSYYWAGEFFGSECFTQRQIVIGRGRDADIQIECDLISRVHAMLRIIGGKVVVEDLGSRNGIYVNGAPVRRASVGNWDTLTIAGYDLKFHLLTYGGRRPSRQLEVLDLDRDPDWEETSEVTALPMQLEAEPTFDIEKSAEPPVCSATHPEDAYLDFDRSSEKVFPLADLLEPDSRDSVPDWDALCPMTRRYPVDEVRRASKARIPPRVRRTTKSTTTRVSAAPSRRLSGVHSTACDVDCALVVG